MTFDRKSAEKTLADFLTSHFLYVDVDIDQAYLDKKLNLAVKLDHRMSGTLSRDTQEAAFNALRDLKRLGVIKTDNSTYDSNGVFPETISLTLKDDAVAIIRKALDEEQGPADPLHPHRAETLANVFEDNRLEFETPVNTTTRKAVAALRQHFASVTNMVFNISKFQSAGKGNSAKVQFVPAAKGEFLDRPKFVVTYGRNTKGAFGHDNEAMAGLAFCFKRPHLHHSVVSEQHSYADATGQITVTGNPHRLLAEVRERVFARPTAG